MMNCEQTIELLSAFYDGELEEALAKNVASHVSQCKECANELTSFKTLGSMIQSNADSLQSSLMPAPPWNAFLERLEVVDGHSRARSAMTWRRKLLIGSSVLAASILLLVSFYLKKDSDSVALDHDHSGASNSAVVIDFEKLLTEKSNQPIATLVSLSNRFEGHEANLEESETQLGYRPSIARALPSGAKLVSNRVLKLPHCNCQAGACTCGPAGCNCAASLCKRSDGSEFLVVEHCATQNVSFGHLKTEMVQAENSELQLLSSGTQLIASWITDRRRLTAIGLNDTSEAQTIVSRLAAR